MSFQIIQGDKLMPKEIICFGNYKLLKNLEDYKLENVDFENENNLYILMYLLLLNRIDIRNFNIKNKIIYLSSVYFQSTTPCKENPSTKPRRLKNIMFEDKILQIIKSNPNKYLPKLKSITFDISSRVEVYNIIEKMILE